VFHAGSGLSGLQFWDFDAFPAPRLGYAPFLACPPNESAKRFAVDIEAGVGEPLPDLFVRLPHLRVDVTGDVQGDTLKVTSIKLL